MTSLNARLVETAVGAEPPNQNPSTESSMHGLFSGPGHQRQNWNQVQQYLGTGGLKGFQGKDVLKPATWPKGWNSLT